MAQGGACTAACVLLCECTTTAALPRYREYDPETAPKKLKSAEEERLHKVRIGGSVGGRQMEGRDTRTADASLDSLSHHGITIESKRSSQRC